MQGACFEVEGVHGHGLPFYVGLKLPSFPQHQVRVQYATEHRCGVVVSGPGLCDCISGTDPLKDNLPLQVDPSSCQA